MVCEVDRKACSMVEILACLVFVLTQDSDQQAVGAESSIAYPVARSVRQMLQSRGRTRVLCARYSQGAWLLEIH